ncbi:MAG: ferredoxin, partial [Candidatus Methanomethylophilaceae archaeon]|nr:ferredoxin [Candidatus Methanomethylophilaceae archaeon]
CPKLDNIDYSDKLSEIFINNSIRNIMIVRMEVPCCSGLTKAVERALEKSGKNIPIDVVTISDNGKIL